MPKHIVINKKIKPFNKIITVSADKSISIRCVLLASQAIGKSKIKNLLESEDVENALKVIKKLVLIKNLCSIMKKHMVTHKEYLFLIQKL